MTARVPWLAILLFGCVRTKGPVCAPSGALEHCTFRGASFDVVRVADVARLSVEILPGGQTLSSLRDDLRHRGRRPVAIMNAGIFEPGYRPTGLLMSHGAAHAPLNVATGTGNFYLHPNGVFAITKSRAFPPAAT